MSISVLDLFKIGIGPSSSHTVGPMRAAHDFATALAQQGVLERVRRIEVKLYGSLSATGVGHSTDRAIIAGLMGARPDAVDPDFVADAVDLVRLDGELKLAGTHTLVFDWARDMRLLPVSLPYHPNAMRLIAHGDDGVVYENTYYSVGGGFVVDEAQAQSGTSAEAEVAVPYPFDTGAELLEQCRRHGLRISELMLANEGAWRSEADTRAALQRIWGVMCACVARGITQEGVLPGGLNVRRRAAALHRKLSERAAGRNLISDTMAALDWVNLYALAVNEENAGGGRVVTAPTNGAAGIIPAVLHYYMDFMPGSSDADVENFLLAAAAVGVLCKKNASISGAEVGCQGEVGSACAMAAAGLTEVLGGSPEQVENAAEIGLEHNLGLTCDPVGGLVQVPCIERNAMASVKAINAAQLALRGDGAHAISLDQVIRTMRDTGRDMLDKYKETSRGGLAVSFPEC
ncbi:L-serine ammonia-lyase [Thauera sp.]|jgi:L-serine dehydratase|uniref:L-serine ammonia-lyase n=1 Tax=Thauera sp. TaxID=1905334 RepID=UPI002A360AD9|nr:L-serine ammonia-lyase [Thauera sp.]MDX9884656.1 L-serine ammonia-lyase [Thauera sp.]